MIEVTHLQKSYRNRSVIDDVSFEIKEKQIAALVGQNGAGKSTTLRMITGYLQPEKGSIKLNGICMKESPREAKAQFGYVPENSPLYEEMTVKEHLKFRGRLQGVSKRELQEAVDSVIEKCSLQEVSNRPILILSKGYRQRVALADALVGSPPVLILDEPTNGLDPHQIVAFRELILSLKNKHTIIISSHILSEVEQIADKVIIINKGTVVSSDHPTNIIQTLRTTSKVKIEVKGDIEQIEKSLTALPHVRRVTHIGETDKDWQEFQIYADSDTDTRENIYKLMAERDWRLRTLFRHNINLESAFVEITMD